MRRFALKNSNGEYFDLMRIDAFFSDPSGLGFDNANEYLQVGSSYILTKEETDQGQIKGKMNFADYAVYKEFADFISYKPLVLFYNPYGEDKTGSIPGSISDDTERNEWWYNLSHKYFSCNGRVSSLSKAEKEKNGYLSSDIVYTAESKWYLSKILAVEKADLSNIKYYNIENVADVGAYKYAFVYPEGFQQHIIVDNDGSEDSPVIISIFGPVTNPIWRLRYNGKTIQSGEATGTIPDGYYLKINSNPDQQEVALYTAQNVYIENWYEFTNFDLETFINVPRGKNYELFVSGETSNSVESLFELDEIYETV